jgi:hypothetical protein
MTRTINRSVAIILAAAAGMGVLLVNDHADLGAPGSLVSQAQAVIGRPLTPMSYAGVARRTTRREVYAVGAASAAAAGTAAYYAAAPQCVQAVDAYGRIYTRCP